MTTCASDLPAIAGSLNGGSRSQAPMRFKGVPERALMAHSDSAGAIELVREHGFSPACDAEKRRLATALLGSLAVGVAPEAAELLSKEQAEACGGAAADPMYAAKLQMSPLESMPIVAGQKTMTTIAVFSHILRGRGGGRKP
ncbi:unnamed protein product, partial [Prorocentrum cordatum]